ncbi:tetratricopeptide repeat protein [Luteimonas aquatica]|uniref:tetratricopeptide repeat protein n=1 Tax=Luteimonas aquatica TaxID=450364 RepID=UPI001F5AC688|nr:tetratricopeptide repeat protein [Luteimonas aquatica]
MRRSCLLLLSACVFALAAALPAPALDRPAAGPGARPVDADTLTATLAGEYALQAGRLEEAADWYLRAARSAGDDAGLAERATRIGLLAKDNVRSAQALALWRERTPRTLGMRGAEVTLALREGDRRAARKGMESLLRDSDPNGWRYALAALNSGARDPKESAALIGALLDAGAMPDQVQAWLQFGGAALRLGDSALVERIVETVIRQFPNEPRVALLRASQLRETGQPQRAREVLAAIERKGALSADFRRGIAAEYDQLGDLAAAEAVLARGPQDDRTWTLRAGLLDKAKNKAGLGTLYAEIKRNSTDPDPDRRLLLGQIAELLGLNDEALAWYASVPGGDERGRAQLLTAKLLHTLKRKDEAYANLRVMQSDAAADDETRGDAYLLEAELRLDDKDARGEMDAYARGLAAYPDSTALLYARALMWERRDDIPRAEADLRKVLVAEPDNTTALNALGYTLADRTTRYTEALELIDRARVAEPDNGAIIDSYGWVLYRLGRKSEAAVELRRAYTLSNDPEIAAHLAEVLWMSGKREEARKYFDEARKADPENRALKRALEKTGA